MATETEPRTEPKREPKTEPLKAVVRKEEENKEGDKKAKDSETVQPATPVTTIKPTPGNEGNTDTDPPAAKKPALEMRYNEFVKMVNEIGKDVKPAYTNSRSHVDRLKRNITTARGILRECLGELDRLSRQQESVRSDSPSTPSSSVIKLN